MWRTVRNVSRGLSGGVHCAGSRRCGTARVRVPAVGVAARKKHLMSGCTRTWPGPCRMRVRPGSGQGRRRLRADHRVAAGRAAAPSSTWPPGRRPATSCWSARRRTPARATRIAAARRRLPMVELDGDGRGRRTRRPGPVPRPVPGPRRARRLPAHVVRRRAAPGAVRGLHHHGLAREGRRLPQRPRRLVRRPDLGPVGRGGLPTSSSWVTPSPGTRCAAWRRRSAERWGTSPASCATATACSSPTPRRAGATSRSTGPSACST